MKNWVLLFALFFALTSGVGRVAHAKDGSENKKYQGLDTNKDGIVTLDEWRADSDRSFDKKDLNNDGVLSCGEVKPRARHPAAKRPAGPDRFSELDYDSNGFVSREEWIDSPRSFQLLDRNRDRQLSRAEFYGRPRYAGSVFQKFDQDNDGNITRDEWYTRLEEVLFSTRENP